MKKMNLIAAVMLVLVSQASFAKRAKAKTPKCPVGEYYDASMKMCMKKQ